MKVVALIPCKDLDRGKSRLAGCLGPRERIALCTFFLRRTLGVAIEAFGHGCVRVVTGDHNAVAIAAEQGVGAIADGAGGLNGALENGRAWMTSEAADCAALILPIDLPLATPAALLRITAEPHDAVIVPDENLDGTNILCLAPEALRQFRFCYGRHSYARHAAAAQAIGIDMRRIDDPELMFDVDHPEQYRRRVQGEPAWRVIIGGERCTFNESW